MKNKLFNYILLILICLNFITWFEFSKSRSGDLEIYILDIGQGDSVLIKTPGNHWGMIDGGPDSSVIGQVDEVLSPFTDKLEFIIFTHADDDHIDGLNNIMQRYSVNYAFIHKVYKNTSTYEDVKSNILKNNIPSYALFDNNDFTIDGVTFNIIWPNRGTIPYSVENVNNTSISVEIVYKDFEYIGLGDLEAKEEREASKNIKSKSIDFLKVSHHGSKTSTSNEFIQDIKPKVALISVGESNRFGHPTEQTLNILRNFDLKILRTDINGRIKISTNGNNSLISSKNEEFSISNI